MLVKDNDVISHHTHSQVRICACCDVVHLTVGPVTLKLTKKAFVGFQSMINRVAKDLKEEAPKRPEGKVVQGRFRGDPLSFT